MKILYLVPQPNRPDRIGAYTFLDEEIQALAAAGVDAHVLSTAVPEDTWCGKVRLRSVDARSALVSRARAAAFLMRRLEDVPRQNVLLPRLWHFLARLEYIATELVKEENFDLIHSHFAWPVGFGGALARAATGRPLIASLRGTDILMDRTIAYGRRVDPSFDRALRILLRKADRTIYFSDFMRSHALSLGARPEAARVIRKGVDLRQFFVAEDRIALRRELGLGDRPAILTVAGLIPRKGVDHILRVLGTLRDEQDFTFVVCGDGPELGRLKALSAQCGLDGRTRFMGRVDRATIPKFFAACDIFVLASIVEAAGNVLFEAMAAGRPVICTNSGGPGEYVRDDETGYVVPVGDEEAMAERIRLLLENPTLQDRLGREAHRRTIGEFDYDRMVADLIDVYRETLSATSRLRVAS